MNRRILRAVGTSMQTSCERLTTFILNIERRQVIDLTLLRGLYRRVRGLGSSKMPAAALKRVFQGRNSQDGVREAIRNRCSSARRGALNRMESARFPREELFQIRHEVFAKRFMPCF